jgi:hypothetical protein
VRSPLTAVKSPFSGTPETKDAAWLDATSPPSDDIAAEHHVAEATGWRRTLEVAAGLALALASALGGANVSVAPQGQETVLTPVNTQTNPPTQPVSGFAWFAPDADLPAHDDAPLRFGDIVRKDGGEHGH